MESSKYKNDLSFIEDRISSHLLKATIQINSSLVKILHLQTIKLYQDQSILFGLKKKKLQ